MPGFTTNVRVRPQDGWVQVVAPAANTFILVRPASKRSWRAFCGAAPPTDTDQQGIPFNSHGVSDGYGELRITGGSTSGVWVRVFDSFGDDVTNAVVFGVFREGP